MIVFGPQLKATVVTISLAILIGWLMFEADKRTEKVKALGPLTYKEIYRNDKGALIKEVYGTKSFCYHYDLKSNLTPINCKEL